ncbi:hypothetical protein ACFRMQ_02000 [Kitasatospora sp. NPDC056783]|uniref:hypothetical protein n=1 Tax=Kitasatospora sp. NPDC056783 TaxID=3345943 RepID=UPI0036913CAE
MLIGIAAVVVPATPAGAAAAPPGGAQRALSGHTVSAGHTTATAPEQADDPGQAADVDSDVLLAATPTGSGVGAAGAGGGWWSASTAEDGPEPSSVWAGRLDGVGGDQRISPDDGRRHVRPVTDGKTVVWSAYQDRSCYLLARPLTDGPVQELVTSQGLNCSFVAQGVEGNTVTYTDAGYKSRPTRAAYLRIGGSGPVGIPPTGGGNPQTTSTRFPSLHDGRIAFDDCRYTAATGTHCRIAVLDVTTGRRTEVADTKLPTPTAITSRYVYWLDIEDDGTGSGPTALRRANLDGSDPVVLSPASGADALLIDGLTASEDAVTVSARTVDGTTGPGAPAKLWQFSPDGAHRERVSCNHGDQLLPAAADARQVVWIDTTTGSNSLVTRTQPVGTCA